MGRLVQECAHLNLSLVLTCDLRYHKAQDIRKEADGWRGIIAALNMQLKKAREDARAAVGAYPERLATVEREKVS